MDLKYLSNAWGKFHYDECIGTFVYYSKEVDNVRVTEVSCQSDFVPINFIHLRIEKKILFYTNYEIFFACLLLVNTIF